MLKNILKLEGAQKLTINEQKEINGGIPPTLCDEGGQAGLSENSCLCKTGTYSRNTNTCSNGSNDNTGHYYEIATGCCYLSL